MTEYDAARQSMEQVVLQFRMEWDAMQTIEQKLEEEMVQLQMEH